MRLATLCGGLFLRPGTNSLANTPRSEMTTSAIKLTSPHELLAVVPYLLGFNPTHSIMVLCLRDHRLGLTQRLDLPRSENAHDFGPATCRGS